MRILTLLTAVPLLSQPVLAGDVQEVTITTPPGQMKYDRPVIQASPGSQVKIVFQNNDEMPHNIVFCRPKAGGSDKGMEVAQEAWKLAEKGEGRGWIPDHPRIWAHSSLVAAHQKEEILLKVPEEPGIYPYVCTFPGHAMVMNGELRVTAAGPGFSDLNYKLYMGDWNRLPDFAALKPHREGGLPERKIDIKLEGMSEHFAVQFSGTLEAPVEGEYQFALASDDGSQLFVDGKALITSDGIHPSSAVASGKVKLTAGPHAVRLDYFEAAGQEEIYLGWSGPNFSETPLSQWIHPSRSGAEPNAEGPAVGIPVAPANGEAVIYRNFIEGSSPRGIAVGYPNGVNICFDAGQMSHVLLWRGAFIDAKQHWTDRGAGQTRPLGFDVVRPVPEGQGMALLADAAAAWPAREERAAGIRFLGYRLDKKRFPAFRYRLGAATVEEYYEPAGEYAKGDGRITRILKFKGAEPNLYLRAATGAMTPHDGGWRHADGFAVTVSGGAAVFRNGNELLVKPEWKEDAAEVRIGLSWVTP